VILAWRRSLTPLASSSRSATHGLTPGASAADLKQRSLTNLYNQRPAWLDIAHKKLDDAVLQAYRWPTTLSDEEVLVRLRLLKLNQERDPV
jgi:hypothetical protein